MIAYDILYTNEKMEKGMRNAQNEMINQTTNETTNENNESSELFTDLENNTQRRLVYIPFQLDAYYINKAKEAGKKINQLMKEALVSYAENNCATQTSPDNMRALINQEIDKREKNQTQKESDKKS